MELKQFLRIALFLLGLCFLTESLGYLTHQIYHFLGIFFLVCYGLSIFPFGKRIAQGGLFFSGCFLLILSVLLLSGSILPRLAGTGMFLFSLGLLVRAKGSEEQEIPLLFLTVTATFYFFLL